MEALVGLLLFTEYPRQVSEAVLKSGNYESVYSLSFFFKSLTLQWHIESSHPSSPILLSARSVISRHEI